jgi:malonate decarboxylase epsilon subunit
MAAVLGLTVPQVRRVVASITTDDDPAYVAVIDTDQQVVIAGSTRALERLTATASRAGARRVQRLDISVPSHCPLLDRVADAMADHLAKIPQRPLTVPYVGDATGRLLHDAGAVLDDLARGIATTVRWRDATALLGELGTTVFIQTPPDTSSPGSPRPPTPAAASSPSPTRHCSPAAPTVVPSPTELYRAKSWR